MVAILYLATGLSSYITSYNVAVEHHPSVDTVYRRRDFRSAAQS